MNFYWVKTNWLIKTIFPKFIWDLPNDTQTVYLTFDDGPTPEITPWVLELLKKHNIKATFFCIGDNIQKYPEIFRQLIDGGHSIGNHTFNHLKGWETQSDEYIQNLQLCEKEITLQFTKTNTQFPKPHTLLFRPPYGKIKKSQTRKVLDLGYRIIMWDVLTVDYDKNVSPEKCLQNAVHKTVPGSIILFHDSIKAFANLEFALPETIKILREKGFQFDAIR